jgi:hypothetical protein
MGHRWGEVHTGFWWGKLKKKKKEPLGRLRHKWEDNIKIDQSNI